MSKTSETKLVEGAREGLTAYLKQGKLNKSDLDDKLDLEGLEINDFERLKRIHFVLSEDVVEFIEQLPDHLRNVKTESRRERKVSRGEIKGRINWGRTFKERYMQNHNDRSIFVTQNPNIEYDIPENLVLKKLLGIVYEVITRDLKNIDYDWREESWSDQTIESLERIFNRNVHIDRIKDADQIDLSSRDLQAAKDSRKDVYRQAHKHYRVYQKIMNDQFDDNEVDELFDNTMIIPDKPTLFELYTIFNLIKSFESKDWELRTIDRSSDPLARLERDNLEIKIFHDSEGSLEFKETLGMNPGGKNKFIQKSNEINEVLGAAKEELISGNKEYLLYNGRPDIIIEYWEKEELKKVVIGEIKYTGSKETFAKGLEQLIEYMKFGRKEGNYLEKNSLDLKGVIIADDVTKDTDRFDGDFDITALETKDIQNDSFSDRIDYLTEIPGPD